MSAPSCTMHPLIHWSERIFSQTSVFQDPSKMSPDTSFNLKKVEDHILKSYLLNKLPVSEQKIKQLIKLFLLVRLFEPGLPILSTGKFFPSIEVCEKHYPWNRLSPPISMDVQSSNLDRLTPLKLHVSPLDWLYRLNWLKVTVCCFLTLFVFIWKSFAYTLLYTSSYYVLPDLQRTPW